MEHREMSPEDAKRFLEESRENRMLEEQTHPRNIYEMLRIDHIDWSSDESIARAMSQGSRGAELQDALVQSLGANPRDARKCSPIQVARSLLPNIRARTPKIDILAKTASDGRGFMWHRDVGVKFVVKWPPIEEFYGTPRTEGNPIADAFTQLKEKRVAKDEVIRRAFIAGRQCGTGGAVEQMAELVSAINTTTPTPADRVRGVTLPVRPPDIAQLQNMPVRAGVVLQSRHAVRGVRMITDQLAGCTEPRVDIEYENRPYLGIDWAAKDAKASNVGTSYKAGDPTCFGSYDGEDGGCLACDASVRCCGEIVHEKQQARMSDNTIAGTIDSILLGSNAGMRTVHDEVTVDLNAVKQSMRKAETWEQKLLAAHARLGNTMYLHVQGETRLADAQANYDQCVADVQHARTTGASVNALEDLESSVEYEEEQLEVAKRSLKRITRQVREAHAVVDTAERFVKIEKLRRDDWRFDGKLHSIAWWFHRLCGHVTCGGTIDEPPKECELCRAPNVGAWAAQYALQADKEGWGIFDARESEGPADWELQHLQDGVDGQEQFFSNDLEAIVFVIAKAKAGSVMHQQAVAILRYYEPDRYSKYE